MGGDGGVSEGVGWGEVRWGGRVWTVLLPRNSSNFICVLDGREGGRDSMICLGFKRVTMYTSCILSGNTIWFVLAPESTSRCSDSSNREE